MRLTSAGFSGGAQDRGGWRARCPARHRSARIGSGWVVRRPWQGSRVCFDSDTGAMLKFATTFPGVPASLAWPRPGPSRPRNRPRRRRPRNPDEAAAPRLHPGPRAHLRELRPRPKRRAAHGARRGRRRRRERVLYVWGESGAGKTHLRAAPSHAARREAPLPPRRNFLPPTCRRSSPWTTRGPPEARQVELFNAFNERAFAFLAVAARPRAPRDMPLRRDLATRLATGLTYRVLPLTDARSAMAPPPFGPRLRALRGGRRHYLLTHARRDMPSLMRALDVIDRYSLETRRPMTVPLLKGERCPRRLAA